MLRLTDGTSLRCSVLVGADGAGSVVAKHLGVAPANYAGACAPAARRGSMPLHTAAVPASSALPVRPPVTLPLPPTRARAPGYTAYRGVGRFPPGAAPPLPRGTVRQMWGAGVRAGLYTISDSEVYWYTCFNAAEARPARAARPPGRAGMRARAPWSAARRGLHARAQRPRAPAARAQTRAERARAALARGAHRGGALVRGGLGRRHPGDDPQHADQHAVAQPRARQVGAGHRGAAPGRARLLRAAVCGPRRNPHRTPRRNPRRTPRRPAGGRCQWAAAW